MGLGPALTGAARVDGRPGERGGPRAREDGGRDASPVRGDGCGRADGGSAPLPLQGSAEERRVMYEIRALKNARASSPAPCRARRAGGSPPQGGGGQQTEEHHAEEEGREQGGARRAKGREARDDASRAGGKTDARRQEGGEEGGPPRKETGRAEHGKGARRAPLSRRRRAKLSAQRASSLPLKDPRKGAAGRAKRAKLLANCCFSAEGRPRRAQSLGATPES